MIIFGRMPVRLVTSANGFSRWKTGSTKKDGFEFGAAELWQSELAHILLPDRQLSRKTVAWRQIHFSY
jgi:hypothetical protein